MNILITGANSYIGESVAKYLKTIEPSWTVTQLDVIGDSWKNFGFRKYDTVYHVAGIAHRKITKDIEPLYYSVNRDLAYDIAVKAKEEGVNHFIFMSSMSVYSDKCTYVDNNTPMDPDNAYGISKMQAEQLILPLADNYFTVSIIRPPMIYGKGCKGNYNSLRKIAINTVFFPRVENKRSMLYIDNLAEFVHQICVHKKTGIFFPQNRELVNTSKWAALIARENGRKIKLSRLLGVGAIIGKHMPLINNYCKKAFGNSYYDPGISRYDFDYQLIDFEQSIKDTEKA